MNGDDEIIQETPSPSEPPPPPSLGALRLQSVIGTDGRYAAYQHRNGSDDTESEEENKRAAGICKAARGRLQNGDIEQEEGGDGSAPVPHPVEHGDRHDPAS